MKTKESNTFRQKMIVSALAAIMPLLHAEFAFSGSNNPSSGSNPCSISNSVVSCSTYDGKSGAIVSDTGPEIGLSAADGTQTLNNALTTVSTPTINVASGTTITTGLKDYATGLSGNNSVNPKAIYDFEGINLNQSSTFNNAGIISNSASSFSLSTTKIGNATFTDNSFYSQNGQSIIFSGDDGTTPQRTVGVWLNADSVTFNNSGTVLVGITNSSLASSNFSNISGTSLANGTIYGVFMNSNNDIISSVTTNNSGNILAYNLTSGTSTGYSPSVVALEAKENVITGYINNTGLIAGYSTRLTTSGSLASGSSDSNGIKSSVFTKASGGVQAIGTDNNFLNLTVTNSGTIGSYGATYNSSSGAATISSGVLGTAIGASTGTFTLTNSGIVDGDITVGKQTHTFTLTNSGTINGSIIITPDAGVGTESSHAGSSGIITSGTAKLIPADPGVLTSSQTANITFITPNTSASTCSAVTTCSSVANSTTVTAGNYVNFGVYLFKVIQSGTTGTSYPSISGALTLVTDANGNYYQTGYKTSDTNQVTISPVATSRSGSTLSGGFINGGLVVGGGTSAVTGFHPFQLTIAPQASGIVIKNGDTYQFASSNIDIKNANALSSSSSGTSSLDASSTANTTAPTTTGISFSNIVIKNTSPLVSWAFSSGSTNTVVATVQSPTTISGISNAGANAISSLINTGSKLATSLQALTTSAALKTAGEQLRPSANNSSSQAGLSAVNQVTSVIGSHQDFVRLASNGQRGVSTGEAASDTGFWVQALGYRGDQQAVGGIDGYSASTSGLILGEDKDIGNSKRLGLAVSYATTSIDGQGDTIANKTTVNSYQGTLYGSWNSENRYLDWAFGLGQHQNANIRKVTFASASLGSSYNTTQYSAKVGLGFPFKSDDITITPVGSLSMVQFEQPSYSESDPSNSGAGLNVQSIRTHSFSSGIGAKFAIPLSDGSLKTTLEARTIWSHEFCDTRENLTSSFSGGTSFTTSSIAPQRDSANVGIGITVASKNGQTLSMNYDSELRGYFSSQSVSMKFRYDF
jgi:outer membrane autotransporter protein